MEIRCYKMLDGRGKIYLPAALREAVGFSRNDVLQVTGRGGVILLNKADVNAADPVELLQEEFRQETAAAAGEREKLRERIIQQLDEGKDLKDILDDIVNEILHFVF